MYVVLCDTRMTYCNLLIYHSQNLQESQRVEHQREKHNIVHEIFSPQLDSEPQNAQEDGDDVDVEEIEVSEEEPDMDDEDLVTDVVIYEEP